MRSTRLASLALVGLLLFLSHVPFAAAADSVYQTGLAHWRAADGGFAGWSRAGVSLTRGRLELDPATATAGSDPYAPGAYYGHNFYNGGTFVVGEATSPEVAAAFPFTEAIASWNADTPAGTWIETLIRVRVATRWTKWYNLGVWAADSGSVERHSVSLQGDGDGYVAIDTFVAAKGVAGDAIQVKVRLFRATGTRAVPAVGAASVTFSTGAPKKTTVSPGNPALWNVTLNVPECSQMVYPDGGNVWCSPTSTSMVLGYWGIDAGPCEPRVRAAVAGVYDWLYDGHGNWPFNTAYAAARGLEAYVVRFRGFADLEPWISAGVPVVISYGWKNDLTGAPISRSSGHLAVVVGFDGGGNPVVNDPAAPTDEDVQRVYLRDELEALWLSYSGGTVYLIYPRGWPVPAF